MTIILLFISTSYIYIAMSGVWTSKQPRSMIQR
uniref:Uncharacterized protein n=1 Tax=Zea mays TaxID=4577 RepID=C4IZX3_MAIZE|nr:unknown [Zea mays]